MIKKKRKRIPINIIAGSLGAGKTTMINHLLELRPDNEQWAVLVNEYGLVGLDAALLNKSRENRQSKDVDIREVAGGCICCSAGFIFEISLLRLLQRRPDRLLIEPTGLAALSGILDTLDKEGIRKSVDVRSIVCLLDPANLEEALLRKEVQDQVEAADVLLASRADLSSPEQLEDFHSWASSLFPAKKHIGQVEHGKIPLSLLDLVSDRATSTSRTGHLHGTDHHHPESEGSGHSDEGKKEEPLCDEAHPLVRKAHNSAVASTIGWICWSGLIFDAKKIFSWLEMLAQMQKTRRVKAVLRTNEGWWSFNFVDAPEELKPSGYRRDSRL